METAARAVPAHPGRADAPCHRAGRSDRPRPRGARHDATFEVEVVVPVHNEAAGLEASITTLRRYLDESFPFRTLVTIADNGSTDGTALIAQRLASNLDGVAAMMLTRKGRGYALRTAWSASQADVLAYMDVDLSTSLSALLPLVGSVLSGHSDLAVGTRLARGSRVVRGPRRELISRAYSHVVRLSLHSRVSDFQCGFKAIRCECARQLLPLVKDDAWFFDTELLVTAERLGLRISETPVEWTDDPNSSVDIVATVADDLRGVWRIARGRHVERVRAQRAAAAAGDASATADQLLSFAGVGVLSTLSYLLLFALGWRALGPWGANAAALAFCTLVNTALHRSLARRSRGARPRRPSFAMVIAVLYGVSLAATSAAIAVAGALVGPSLVADAVAATIASCAASLARFSLLRGWAFRPLALSPLAPVPGR
ncbi:MAG TPA: glycosyltransferase [Acidimicrobiales bacterium]|nr:glycosyltransferase [Acidimicrobiales bacterium]